MSIWKNITIKRGINYRDAKEFLNFSDKIDIIPIDDEGRTIIYLNNRIHFYNGIGVITPSNEDILNYDKEFYNLLDNREKFCNIILEIFYVCGGLQLKKKEKNRLDILIDKLEAGEYGNIHENDDYHFLELYPYIRSGSFYCKDVSRKSSTKDHKHKEDFGGRCIDLLSIKKYIIENANINYALSYEELARIGAINLREMMMNNKIPPNPCTYIKDSKAYHEKDLYKQGPNQKKIFEFK